MRFLTFGWLWPMYLFGWFTAVAEVVDLEWGNGKFIICHLFCDRVIFCNHFLKRYRGMSSNEALCKSIRLTPKYCLGMDMHAVQFCTPVVFRVRCWEDAVFVNRAVWWVTSVWSGFGYNENTEKCVYLKAEFSNSISTLGSLCAVWSPACNKSKHFGRGFRPCYSLPHHWP